MSSRILWIAHKVTPIRTAVERYHPHKSGLRKGKSHRTTSESGETKNVALTNSRSCSSLMIPRRDPRWQSILPHSAVTFLFRFKELKPDRKRAESLPAIFREISLNCHLSQKASSNLPQRTRQSHIHEILDRFQPHSFPLQWVFTSSWYRLHRQQRTHQGPMVDQIPQPSWRFLEHFPGMLKKQNKWNSRYIRVFSVLFGSVIFLLWNGKPAAIEHRNLSYRDNTEQYNILFRV
jgi:hypothetical protein